MRSLIQSAPALQVTLMPVELNSKDDLATAFDDMKRGRSEALLVVSGGLTYGSSKTIAIWRWRTRCRLAMDLRKRSQLEG